MKENSTVRLTVSALWTQTAFEPPIQSWLQPRTKQYPANAELHQLKARLLEPILERTEEPDLCHRLRLAANEALADAMRRPSPFLVLPCLIENKVREVQQWFQRQQRIREVTQKLFQSWSDGVEECWNLRTGHISPSFH
jgi:hypothetical protein